MIAPKPLFFEKIWGCEYWIASAYKGASQKDFTAAFGEDFPLLIKVIQADKRLSVQLHPDDKAAILLEGEGSRGKSYLRTKKRVQPQRIAGGDTRKPP